MNFDGDSNPVGGSERRLELDPIADPHPVPYFVQRVGIPFVIDLPDLPSEEVVLRPIERLAELAVDFDDGSGGGVDVDHIRRVLE